MSPNADSQNATGILAAQQRQPQTLQLHEETPTSVEEDCSSHLTTAPLETMDACVLCIEGVATQTEFEDRLGTKQLVDRMGAGSSSFGNRLLNATEANMVRTQIHRQLMHSEEEEKSSLPDLDVLHLCVGSPPKNSNMEGDSETARTISKNQCAICLDQAPASASSSEPNHLVFAQLPCCGKEGETVNVCTACVLVLSYPTGSDSNTDNANNCTSQRVGRCPRCLAWISVQTAANETTNTATINTTSTSSQPPLHIGLVDQTGKCSSCKQSKRLLVTPDQVCDACFLGRHHPLLYECQDCRGIQRIPHPMYRYQSAPDAFGSVTWTCESSKCQGFAHWRLHPGEVEKVPLGDAPWSEHVLEAARKQVGQTRRQLHMQAAEDSCVLL